MHDVAEFPDIDCLSNQLHKLEFELNVDPLYNFTSGLQNTSCFHGYRWFQVTSAGTGGFIKEK